MLDWIDEVLADIKLDYEPAETSRCQQPEIGNLIFGFGAEFIEDLLDLSDRDINQIYPQRKCPLHFAERQKLKSVINDHLRTDYVCFEKEQVSILENQRAEEFLYSNPALIKQIISEQFQSRL